MRLTLSMVSAVVAVNPIPTTRRSTVLLRSFASGVGAWLDLEGWDPWPWCSSGGRRGSFGYFRPILIWRFAPALISPSTDITSESLGSARHATLGPPVPSLPQP
jgi:hypothetical protein